MIFADRSEAGRALASSLEHYKGRPDGIVLGLPRGGIPVAREIAQALRLPLDVFIVRKLGVPDQEELAMGAIAMGDVRVINDEVVRQLRIPQEVIDAVTQTESKELRRREQAYRGDRPPLDVRGRLVILVDDGLATGSTMRAAIAALRQMGPARIVVAVPVGAAESCKAISRKVDEIVCSAMPEPFYAIGQWYRDFRQTTDAEVCAMLRQPERDTSRIPQ
jgi:predicted phosphoribosyltransferase